MLYFYKLTNFVRDAATRQANVHHALGKERREQDMGNIKEMMKDMK